jgi:hypothetical protein
MENSLFSVFHLNSNGNFLLGGIVSLKFTLKLRLHFLFNMKSCIHVIDKYSKVNYKFIEKFYHNICTNLYTYCTTVAVATECRVGLLLLPPPHFLYILIILLLLDTTIWVKWKIFTCNLTSIVVDDGRGSLVKGRIKLKKLCFRKNFLPK